MLTRAMVTNPAGINMFKVNNRNTIIRCEICSKPTIKTVERRRQKEDSEAAIHLRLIRMMLMTSSYFHLTVKCSLIFIHQNQRVVSYE